VSLAGSQRQVAATDHPQDGDRERVATGPREDVRRGTQSDRHAGRARTASPSETTWTVRPKIPQHAPAWEPIVSVASL